MIILPLGAVPVEQLDMDNKMKVYVTSCTPLIAIPSSILRKEFHCIIIDAQLTTDTLS